MIDIPEPAPPVVWREDALILQLSYPPTVNHYYVEFCKYNPKTNKYRVDKAIGERGRNFRQELYRIKLQYHRLLKPFTNPIQVEVQFMMPDRRRRDIADNVIKPLCDALTYAQFWNDDHIIQDFRSYKAGVESPGMTTIRIQEFKPEGK